MANKPIPKSMHICQVDCCDSPRYALGYCIRHYGQHYRHGFILKRTRFDPNEFIIEGDICRIKLYDRRGNETGEAIVDGEDYEKINGKKWHRCTNGYVAYIDGRKWISLHSVILETSEDEVIDHINRDGLDCRKANLRVCAHHQNCWNQGLRKNNVSGAKGVCWYKQTKRWVVRIRHKNKRVHLGYFKNKADAVEAYNKAALKYHGEFVALNKL